MTLFSIRVDPQWRSRGHRYVVVLPLPELSLLNIMTSSQKIQKPVYDCKGIIAVKFSVVKQNPQVQYKHVLVHKSYDQRVPPPRCGTNLWKLVELHDPERYVIMLRSFHL